MYKVHALNAGLLQDKSLNLIYCYAAKDKYWVYLESKKEMYKYLYHVECKNARTNADKKLEKTLFREINNENVPFFVKIK